MHTALTANKTADTKYSMPTEIQRPWCKCVFRNARSGLSFIKVVTVVTSCSFAKAILAHLSELVKYLSASFSSFFSNSILLLRPISAGHFSMFARCQSLSARPNIPHDFLFVNTIFTKIARNFEISLLPSNPLRPPMNEGAPTSPRHPHTTKVNLHVTSYLATFVRRPSSKRLSLFWQVRLRRSSFLRSVFYQVRSPF